MTINELPKQTNISSSSRQKNVYSFEYQKKSESYVCDSSNEQDTVEPFDNEKEALEFVNFYAQKVINKER